MHQLSKELAKSMIEDRSQNFQVMKNYSTKIAIESVIGRPVNPVETASGPTVERREGRNHRFLPYIINRQSRKKGKHERLAPNVISLR